MRFGEGLRHGNLGSGINGRRGYRGSAMQTAQVGGPGTAAVITALVLAAVLVGGRLRAGTAMFLPGGGVRGRRHGHGQRRKGPAQHQRQRQQNQPGAGARSGSERSEDAAGHEQGLSRLANCGCVRRLSGAGRRPRYAATVTIRQSSRRSVHSLIVHHTHGHALTIPNRARQGSVYLHSVLSRSDSGRRRPPPG